MDFFSIYATDPVAEINGRPFSEEFGGDCTFVVARAGNRTYNRMIQKLFDAHNHTLRQKDTEEQEDAAEELAFKLIGQVMAKTILLGWSGSVKYKGADLPYSYDNALLLLSMPEFRKKINELASDFRKFLVEQEAEDVKNSEPTSNGTSNGDPSSTT